MALNHALSSNNYGPNKFIVATSAANGTHTTLAGAISDSTAGDTIIMRDSVTEDVTLKAGVNIYADGGSGNAYAVSITGNCTATAAGIFTIVGVKLNTNGASLLTVSGSAATQVILERCYLNIGGSQTGITFSSSSSSSTVVVTNCTGNYAGSGALLYNCTSAGQIEILQTEISNSSLSTAAATSSAGITTWRRSRIDAQVQTTSTATLQIEFSDIWTNALNITAVVNNGTGVSSVLQSRFDSGTATCVTCGSGASITLADVVLGTTNGTRTSGSGTITIIGSEQVATSYATDSGTATPVSSTGVLTISGSNGVVISGSGSTVTVTGPSTSNGFDPSKGAQIYEDFLGYSYDSSVAGTSIAEWSVISAAGTATFNQTTQESGHPGIVGNSSIAAVVNLRRSGSVASGLILGIGALSCVWIFRVSALSNAGSRYVLRLGLTDQKDTTATTDAANGVYIQYSDNVNSGNYQFKSSSASSVTTSNSSITADTTWQVLAISVNAAGTSVSYSLNGVSLGTAITTNIPTAAINLSCRIDGTSAANSVRLDMAYVNQTFTTPRY